MLFSWDYFISLLETFSEVSLVFEPPPLSLHPIFAELAVSHAEVLEGMIYRIPDDPPSILLIQVPDEVLPVLAQYPSLQPQAGFERYPVINPLCSCHELYIFSR